MSLLKAPRVSVVITSYNYVDFIEECLDSIAKQSIADFHCVVVDDGSTNDSSEKITRFVASDAAAGRFEFYPHESNLGQMAGFLTGLGATDGEFVVFLDADDLLFPDFLEVHLKAHLNPHHSIAFTCSDQVQISADGDVVSATNPTFLRDNRDPTRLRRLADSSERVMRKNRELEVRQSFRTPLYLPPITSQTGTWPWSATSAMMFRRATLDLILHDDCAQFRICADYYLCMFAHVVGGSLIIPSAHGCYRRHGENAFGSSRIVGSDRSVRVLTRGVSVESFHDVFIAHLLGKFEIFRDVVDEHQLYMIVAKFASPELLRRLGKEVPLNQMRLFKSRVNWWLAGLIVWLRTRFFWVRRMTGF